MGIACRIRNSTHSNGTARDDPDIKAIADLARHRAYNVIGVIYQSKAFEGHSKDPRVPVEEFPVEKCDAILAINLSAAFHGIAAAVPQMKETGLGPNHQYRLGARAGWLDP